MLEAPAKITEDREVVELGTSLQPARMRVVGYMIGPFGPFSIRMPVAEFSYAKVEELINQHVEQLRALGTIPRTGS